MTPEQLKLVSTMIVVFNSLQVSLSKKREKAHSIPGMKIKIHSPALILIEKILEPVDRLQIPDLTQALFRSYDEVNDRKSLISYLENVKNASFIEKKCKKQLEKLLSLL